MGVISDYQKIGVVGIYNSGKTVFLTSLINHILHHEPRVFRVRQEDVWRKAARVPIVRSMVRGLAAQPIRIRKARPMELKEGETPFEYDRYRDDLMRSGIWPGKTERPSHYRLRFELSSRPWRDSILHFYDFPGERIADAAIALLDYEAWSDHTLKRIENDADYRTLAGEFLELQHDRSQEREAAIRAYKLALARFRQHYRPMISPSSFIIDGEGRLIDSRQTPEEMIEGRYCGSEEGSEFIPLGEAARQANEELASDFRLAYDRYKREQVLPALNDLRSCDRLVVLVDLPTILNSGHLMANDVHDITKDLLDFCDPGKNFLEKLYALSGIPFFLRRTPLEELANTKITRIAFVASKCDLVHESDRDNLVMLLKELMVRLPDEYEGAETDFFACSAVQSTVSDPNGQGLIGLPEYTGEGISREEDMLVTVSRVPQRFPDRWQPGEFCFPDFRPRKFPGLKTRPPKQLGLDRVFSFILGSKWTD